MKNLNYIHEAIMLKASYLDIYSIEERSTLRNIHFEAKYITHQDELHSGEGSEFYTFIGVGVGGDRSQTKAERKRKEHEYREYARTCDRMADDGPYGRII
jgi:ribonucleotide reductase beta subunit family protein with ferritin-like domain